MDTNLNPFEVDSTLAAGLAGGMNDGDGVKLPFPHISFWWRNGSPDAWSPDTKPTDVAIFGGWCANVDKVNTATLPALPKEWAVREFSGKDSGKSYGVYAVRSLAFVPICRRSQWQHDEEKGKDFSTINVLGMIGTRSPENVITPWAPGVLTGSWTKSKDIEDLFRNFATNTARARIDLANGLGPEWFWHFVGSIGKKPYTEKRGKDTQSTVTPAQVFLPDEITVEHLRAWFIGNATARVALDLRTQAKEWLDEWKREPRKKTAPKSAPVEVELEETAQPPDELGWDGV